MTRELLQYLRQFPFLAAWELGLTALFAEIQQAERDGAVHRSTERAVARRSGDVAVIGIQGVITPKPTFWEAFGFATSVETLVSQLRAALADDAVKAVVLDVDSPGGSVSGVPEAFEAILGMRGKKPIVAHARYLAASAAYYLASAADSVVASPSAMVGSVGVYVMHVDASKMLDDMGWKITFVQAGEDKTLANPYEPLEERGQAYLQGIVDDAYRMFVGDVARGRGITDSAVAENYGQGRVLVAADALKAGVIDKIRTLDETLAALGVARGVEKSYATSRAQTRLQLVDL